MDRVFFGNFFSCLTIFPKNFLRKFTYRLLAKNTSKMPQECVFGLQNAQKFSACGGHIVIEIRLVMLLSFFSRLQRTIIVCLCFMLVYRAPLHKHKTLSFCLSLRRAQITVFFSFLHVYRAPLDKHKTLNFDPMQARKKRTLEAFTKGDFFIFRRLWRTNTY